jgi:hypothetical protein
MDSSTNYYTSTSTNAVYIIIAVAVLWLIYNYDNLKPSSPSWNYPAAPYLVTIMIMLLISAILLAKKYGLIVGLIALIWPFTLEPLVADLTGCYSLIPAGFLFMTIFIFSIVAQFL